MASAAEATSRSCAQPALMRRRWWQCGENASGALLLAVGFSERAKMGAAA